VKTEQPNVGPTQPVPEVLHPFKKASHSSSVVKLESLHYLALQPAVVAVAVHVHLLDVSLVVAAAQIAGVL
jgi:hypothetical protein